MIVFLGIIINHGNRLFSSPVFKMCAIYRTLSISLFTAHMWSRPFTNCQGKKKTGTEKLLRSGILLHKKRLFLLVTQQFELLLALVLGDLLTPFFLQVTHFFTFLHYTVYKTGQAGLPKVCKADPDRQTFGSHAYSNNITPFLENSQ